jgi:membrane-associated phospholipid phosphatase
VALVVLYVVAVHTSWGQQVDDAALSGRTTRPNVLHATDRLLNTISITSIVLIGAVIVAVALARGRWHLAITAAVVILGANLTTEFLKHELLGRHDLVTGANPLPTPSFPSGHTTVAMSLALGLVLVVPASIRAVTALGGLAYAGLVGTGTVTAGWHRPSDAMGAYLVATAWAAAGAAGLIWWRGTVRARGRDREDTRIVSPLLIGAGIGLLLIGFLGFAATFVVLRQDRLDAVDINATYAAALAAILGVACVCVAALLATLRSVNLDPLDDDAVAPVSAFE